MSNIDLLNTSAQKALLTKPYAIALTDDSTYSAFGFTTLEDARMAFRMVMDLAEQRIMPNVTRCRLYSRMTADEPLEDLTIIDNTEPPLFARLVSRDEGMDVHLPAQS